MLEEHEDRDISIFHTRSGDLSSSSLSSPAPAQTQSSSSRPAWGRVGGELPSTRDSGKRLCRGHEHHSLSRWGQGITYQIVC